ncbi:TIGR01459 family HAD-type hydrolase [Chachezhania antarctica]|uniref:TIGR01459 family HAD-type hydrolase n=1 Tax=Chachezhania antarctica TaxID=2340860 RepID=UPI000EAEF491|nr:TIGR01459 family HAD-type hydrolase [Chachezhania antarctica]|tara:strand:+ start:8682 stop:9596 length:915 start_codon:yes stop_codon:yes gene_type:complete
MGHIGQSLSSSFEFSSFSEIVSRYDGVLCDVWGVIHNGTAAFNDAVDALCRVRASGRFVILITNAPRLSRDIYPQLKRFGVPRSAFDTIVTSGDVTAALLARQPDAPLFHFGPARDMSVLEGLPNPIVEMSDAQLCLLTGPLDDEVLSVDNYERQLTEMQQNAVTVICANPDLVVRSGNRMVICAGSIAQRYVALGGKVVFAGKPEAAIYDDALIRANGLAGRTLRKRHLLAIGDGLPTDIMGAANNGFDAYFITGGIHAGAFGNMKVEAEVTMAAKIIRGQYANLSLVGLSDRLQWMPTQVEP